MKTDRRSRRSWLPSRMSHAQAVKAIALAALVTFALVSPARATTVWTNRNDNSRSGAVLNETVLNQTNVNQTTFGYLFTCKVDNTVYTQPLYVPNVTIAGVVHNVMFVGTVQNSMYAFDADTGALLWHNSYPTAPSIDDAAGGCYPYGGPNAGLTGTPVIDTSTNTMYFSTRTKNSDGSFSIWLYAVDLATGNNKFNSPQQLSVSPAAIAQYGSFTPQYLYQRAALTLANGTVYLSFAALGDCGDYRGWTLGYDASDISQQQYAVADVNIPSANAPNYCYLNSSNACVATGNQAGIWMAGNGFVADTSGNLIFATGNGEYDGTANYGDSVMKVSSSLSVLDWFTPSNQATLSANDLDVGSVGVTLLPGGSRAVAGCKDGRIFLLDTSNLGQYNATSDNVIEEFQATTAGADSVRSTPIYYNSPTNGLTLYTWPNNDGIKAFQYAGGLINSTPIATNSVIDGGYDSVLSISANGSATGTGIVWASESSPSGLFGNNTLYAFNADNLSVLYDSDQDASRDNKIGSWVRFTPPTVANGKVYVPSNGGGHIGVAVFGLLAGDTPPPTGLTATAANAEVILNWTASSGATSYSVYRSTTSGGEMAPSAEDGIATTSYTDTNVVNGTAYYYMVVAVGSLGASIMSNEATATPYVQTLTSVVVSPGPSETYTLPVTQQFTATANDQFGDPLIPQPTITWGLAAGGAGSIDFTTGLYHGGQVPGTATVKAKSGTVIGTSAVTLDPAPVTIATAASATPVTVTGATTNLSARGAYAGSGGAGALTYTWSAVGPASVTYSANGTNAAKDTTATFSQAGSYTFTVTIASPYTSTTSSVTVTVNQTLTSIVVSPGPTMTLGPPLPQSQQFTATANDQFGNALATQPAFVWSLASGSVGSITDSGGLYHSGTVAGTATVRARSGTVMGTSDVTVN